MTRRETKFSSALTQYAVRAKALLNSDAYAGDHGFDGSQLEAWDNQREAILNRLQEIEAGYAIREWSLPPCPVSVVERGMENENGDWVDNPYWSSGTKAGETWVGESSDLISTVKYYWQGREGRLARLLENLPISRDEYGDIRISARRLESYLSEVEEELQCRVDHKVVQRGPEREQEQVPVNWKTIETSEGYVCEFEENGAANEWCNKPAILQYTGNAEEGPRFLCEDHEDYARGGR